MLLLFTSGAAVFTADNDADAAADADTAGVTAAAAVAVDAVTVDIVAVVDDAAAVGVEDAGEPYQSGQVEERPLNNFEEATHQYQAEMSGSNIRTASCREDGT